MSTLRSGTIDFRLMVALFLLVFMDHMICCWLHYCGESNPTLGIIACARDGTPYPCPWHSSAKSSVP